MNSSLLSRDSRVILISCANRGIGRAITERLYDEGYSLSLSARKPESLEPLIKRMETARILTHAYDARMTQSSVDWITATFDRFDRVDGVVNNAGVMYSFDVENDDESKLHEMWEVNAKAPLRLIRTAFHT